MDEQDRSDHATNVTETDGNITAVGDIVERLQKSGERPYCYCALFKGYAAEALEAADEIERLQVQVRGQALQLLVAHSELLGLYDLTMDDRHTPDETDAIRQQHSDYVDES